MSRRSRGPKLLAAAVLLLATGAAAAPPRNGDGVAAPRIPGPDRVIEVPWMQDLEPILAHATPGTRIELASGAYRPQTIRGLRGTRERPIVIAGPSSGGQPLIGGGSIGLHLIDVEHVVIDGLAFRDQSDAAIRVESVDGAAASVRLTRIRIHGLREGADGIDIRNARDVTIDDLIVRNWGRAAIRLDGASGVRLDSCRLLAFGRRAHPIGIEAINGTDDVIVERLSAEHRIVDAVRLGVGGTAPVRRIVVRDSLVRGAETGVRFGDCASVVIDRCTVVDVTTALLRFDPPVHTAPTAPAGTDSDGRDSGARGVAISACIFDWSRRPLERLIVGVPEDGVRLGRNLWHGPDAAERIAAIEAVRFGGEGDEAAHQTVDLDPGLDPQGNAPMATSARFGARGTIGSAGSAADPAAGE